MGAVSADPGQEVAASVQAGDIIADIYEALLEECEKLGPVDAELLHSLNVLCVRIVFCFYAESAGVFGRHGMFREYMQRHQKDARAALTRLFAVLDTPVEKRERFLEAELAEFPYANGGLFGDVIEMPPIPDEVAFSILFGTGDGFNWRDISPTIFGAIFESTLNPQTRKTGGMHYTSIENIHKVIDPLFLDDLKAELAAIKGEYQAAREKSELGSAKKSNVTARRQTPVRNRNKALAEFRKKLPPVRMGKPFLCSLYNKS